MILYAIKDNATGRYVVRDQILFSINVLTSLFFLEESTAKAYMYSNLNDSDFVVVKVEMNNLEVS